MGGSDSMSSRGFQAAFLFWIVFIVLDSMFAGTFTGTSNLNALLNLNFIEWKDFLFIPIPVPNFSFLTTLWNLATWNLFFFSGPTEWVRLILALTIMSGLVWAIYTQLIPVFIGAISAVGSVLRAANPFSS